MGRPQTLLRKEVRITGQNALVLHP